MAAFPGKTLQKFKRQYTYSNVRTLQLKILSLEVILEPEKTCIKGNTKRRLGPIALFCRLIKYVILFDSLYWSVFIVTE